MSPKLHSLFLGILLLAIAICGAACSSTNAATRKRLTIPDDKSEVSKTEYKETKRVSKDVITSDKKKTETKQK